MSVQGTMAFHERLLTDGGFQERAAAAVEGKQGARATGALLQLAASEGLELTAGELETLRGTMVAGGELSTDQLEAVSGGTMDALDLQNMLKRQQQMLQTMSNLSKMYHDTAKSIIRKIGG